MFYFIFFFFLLVNMFYFILFYLYWLFLDLDLRYVSVLSDRLKQFHSKKRHKGANQITHNVYNSSQRAQKGENMSQYFLFRFNHSLISLIKRIESANNMHHKIKD